MELNKALPVVRAAVKQVNVIRTTETIQTGLINGARTQHTSGYKGRQERIPAQGDDVSRMDETQINNMGKKDAGESLTEKANQLKESVKDTAYNLKETIKEKTGLGNQSPSTARRLGADQQRSTSPARQGTPEFKRNTTMENQEREYDNVAQGSSQMGAEGNVWDASQHNAKESTADHHGPSAGEKTIVEKVTDMVKGATATVSEKMGLKK
jgi:hypothetical protein